MSDNLNISKNIKTALMAGIGFITYNIILFIICGFSDHGASFWISYAFMLVALATFAVSALAIKTNDTLPKGWLLNYPVLKHCTIYAIAELAVSTLFIGLDYADCHWAIALVAQLVLFAVFAVIIISNFSAKQMINEVHLETSVKASKMKLLQTEVEAIVRSAATPEVATAYTKLAEQIRFSDPMSSDALNGLDSQIELAIGQAKTFVSMNNVEASLNICKTISDMIIDRNTKCKILK